MCDADLPPAGGNAPVWQLAHWFATGAWLWVHGLGFQALVVWQATQLPEPTGIWLAPLPVAALPSWQPAQLVDTL